MQASIKTYTPVSDEVFLRRSQSTASRKTQTSLDMIEKDVERIKAQIKTGDDIDAQEVLQAVLLMLDDMRFNMKQLKVNSVPKYINFMFFFNNFARKWC